MIYYIKKIYVFLLFISLFASKCNEPISNRRVNRSEKVESTQVDLNSINNLPVDTLYYDSSIEKKSTDIRVFKIVEKIVKYNNCIGGKSLGVESSHIAHEVFDMVYYDSIISDELKFDLIHIMIYFQESATRQHRNIVFGKIKSNDLEVMSNLQFAIPFLFCHYCQDTDILEVVMEKQNYLRNTTLPLYYQKYNEKLWKRLNEIDYKEKKESYKLKSSINIGLTIIPVYLSKKYLSLPKERCGHP